MFVYVARSKTLVQPFYVCVYKTVLLVRASCTVVSGTCIPPLPHSVAHGWSFERLAQ